VRTGWSVGGAPDGLFSDQERRFGIHGGDAETSLLLHLRPETVDMSKAMDFRSTAETSEISPIGPTAYGWIASDLNPDGVVGEAHLATAEKGRLAADKMVEDMIGLLRKIAAQSLDGFKAHIGI
jgi:creatinine amidohydrolase